jgi:hypothetical protein
MNHWPAQVFPASCAKNGLRSQTQFFLCTKLKSVVASCVLWPVPGGGRGAHSPHTVHVFLSIKFTDTPMCQRFFKLTHVQSLGLNKE